MAAQFTRRGPSVVVAVSAALLLGSVACEDAETFGVVRSLSAVAEASDVATTAPEVEDVTLIDPELVPICGQEVGANGQQHVVQICHGDATVRIRQEDQWAKIELNLGDSNIVTAFDDATILDAGPPEVRGNAFVCIQNGTFYYEERHTDHGSYRCITDNLIAACATGYVAHDGLCKVPCTSDTQCVKPGEPKCDTTNGVCEVCLINADCGAGKTCNAEHMCVP